MSAISEDNENRQGETDDKDSGEFTRLKTIVLAGHRHRSEWRAEARRAFSFVAGHQWSEADKRTLQSQNRPPITFNRVAPIVKAVCGLEVNNRQSVVYLPREQGDVGVDETITATAKWVRDECCAEDEESSAFRDSVICGEGWTETRMEYDVDPQGKIIKEKMPPLEMGCNAGVRKADHADAHTLYRVREMEGDDARVLLGLPEDTLNEAIHARWMDDNLIPADGGTGNKTDYPSETRSGVVKGSKRKKVRVIQVQYWVRETRHIIAQDGQEELQTLTPEEFVKFEERASQAIDPETGQPLITYQSAKVPKKIYYECFLIADTIVGKRELQTGGFQWNSITGDYDEEDECFYGVVRDMFDPQMWANKWLSQTMHILNTNAKGGIIAEQDAFQNIRKAERDWADPTKIIWVKPGTLQKQKIKERQAINLPQGLDGLMAFAISSIRDVTGVNLELLGQADREQAASLEMQRRQSAMTVLASLFDSLRRYRKRDGKTLLHFIRLLPQGTLVRVQEKDKIQYVPLIMDKDVEKYDIIIDEAPSSPDQKQFIWTITSQILQMGILPPAAIVELLKYSPYPETVVREIRKAMGLDGEMPPEAMKQKLQQAEEALQVLEKHLQEAMASAKTAEDDRAVDMMKVEIDEYKAETERLKVRLDAYAKMEQAANTEPTENVGDAPSLAGGGVQSQAQPNGIDTLNQKVDQLAGMLGQLMQAMGGGQPPAEAQPVPPISEETI